MTTVATDGKTIAADTQSLNGSGTANKVTKLWRFKDGSIFGVAGDLQDGILAKEWFENGGEKPKLSENFSGLLIRKGKIFKVENQLAPWEIQPPASIGTGRDFSLMAMVMGISPADSIHLIIQKRLDVGTGGEVHEFIIGEQL